MARNEACTKSVAPQSPLMTGDAGDFESTWLAFVAHELRNPLTAIRGYASLMQRGQTYDARALDRNLHQSQRLERLIGDLLEVSTLDAHGFTLRPTEVDLVVLARTHVDEAQLLSQHHKVRLQAARKPPVGWWDGDRVGQVLENLLTNAIKYSPGGEIICHVAHHEREAQVSITDQGPGIPAADLAHLFERFYRGNGAGTGGSGGFGLGLYLSKMFVEMHGGRIWADSQLGCGSTFTFTLPYRGQDGAIASL